MHIRYALNMNNCMLHTCAMCMRGTRDGVCRVPARESRVHRLRRNTQQVPRDTRNTSLFACSEAPSRALLLRLATVTPSQNVTFNHNRLSARALVV